MTAGSISVPTIVPLRVPVTGKLKNVIDTNTPIELKTETPNAEIFFTIDGSKPDPFAALGVDRSTIKYTKPFKLREGKKTVKAVALSRDGTRESHIVTKCFEIEKDLDYDNNNITEQQENVKKSKSNNYGFIDEIEKERKKELIKKRSILKKIVDSNANISYRSEGGGSDNETSRYGKETKFLGKRFSNKTLNFTVDYPTSNLNKSQSHLSNEELNKTSNNNSRYIMPDSSVQALKLQRETDFLKCVSCFARRPNDPQARCCTECGASLPQIPQTKLVPPQSGQLGTCFYCKSLVPFNTSICVICENPIIPQLEPQASVKLQGKIHCPNCMTSNPANYKTCVACDAKIENGKVNPVSLSMIVPQYPVASGKSSTCSQCFRVNRNDSRFCDWCGAKPLKQLGPLACLRCGSNNNPYSKFCIACGSLIQPPSNQNANTISIAGSGNNNNNNNNTSQPTWLTHIDSKAMQILNKQYNTISTQTYGLFYTSSKGIENQTDKEEKAMKLEKESRDRKPNLTAVSAGKGYWRQQMDHICAHLKAYAQNNSEFRVAIGEPKLGKISTAKVDMDSSWCTITCTYPIRSLTNKDSFNSSAIVDRALNHSSSSHKMSSHFNNADYEHMSHVIGDRNSSLSEESISEYDDDDEEQQRDKYERKQKMKKNKMKKSDLIDDKLTGEDRQLVKELGKQGRGRPKEVRNLLNEGANAKVITKDGFSMLHLAVRNKHFECVPILIDANADVDYKLPDKLKGNTVLHEAVLIGNEADSLIKVLLEYGANPNIKNAKNETPFELAIKENNTAALNILGSQVGTDMLKTYLRTKSNVDIRP